MELTRLNQKGIMLGIKNGMTLGQFFEKYNCTEEEFVRHLCLLYSRDKKQPQKIMSEIRANEKKSRKNPRAKSSKPVSEIASENAIVEEARNNDLDMLKTLEKTQSREVLDIEVSHKKLAVEHRDKLKQLREIDRKIEEIREVFKKCYSEYETIVGENNKITAEMNRLAESRKVKAKALDETRAAIKALEAVTLFVYDSGEFSSESDRFTLDDSGADELYGRLIFLAECQDLRAREIRTLARVLKVVEHSTLEVELVFENSELEKVFNAAKAG